MASRAAHPLRFFHLVLAALGVILIVLNATLINWATPERSVATYLQSDEFSRQSASLLVPDVAMVFMYLFLAVGRPRFSSQFNHTLCRILFSLVIAVGLLYRHSEYLDKQVQIYKIREFFARSRGNTLQRSLAEDYFCVLGDVTGIPAAIVEHKLNECRVRVTSSVLSFFAAFMVVVELFVAARRGDIGEKKKKEKEAGEEVYHL
ncbi:hypothetical protein BGZ81_004438 [Podila clonocystis]|nr:hypothetical protein BGZ81_004438 [Podila clonocystis]